MVSKEYPRIGEKIYHAELPNGLHIYVDRRPEFQKSYAFFATNYGGMDMKFRLDGQWRDTPAGVAHFLEHKMFDTEDGNALQDLAANGASPNAFTSSALTGYYFENSPLLRVHSLVYPGERGQGAGDHRPGDPHGGGRSGQPGVLRPDGVPV